MAAESAVRILFLGDSASAVRSVSRLETAFGGLGRTTRLVAGALGIALVGGLAAATKAAIEFQHQMELIHTQAGASSKEVDRMSKAVLGLAASVGTGPEDLAKGLFHIESAGIRGAHALEILKAAAEGAKVGGANLEDTTNALIGAFTSGVKGAGSMEHAMAVLNATVGAGNMRMQDLTSAMGTGLLSAARGVGISMQDVGAALAELTVQNENASEASTRLQMAFLTMAANTSKGAAALKSIGIAQNQLATDMRSHGLIFALQDLQTHLQASGKTATEQTAIIADVFGRRSLKAILPLLQHLDDVRKRQEAINKTTGNFGEAWTATQQTVTFQMARAKAALQAAFIPIGTLMLPLVTRLAQAVGSAAQFITQHMGQIQAAAHAAAQAIGAAWGRYAIPVLHEFGKLAVDIGRIVQQAWPAIKSMAESVGRSLGSVFRSVGQIIQALMPLLRALAPEFKIAFALILLDLRVSFAAIAALFRGIAIIIRAVALPIAFLVRSFNQAVGAMISAAKSLASGIAGAFGGVINTIQTVIGWIQKLIGWAQKIPSIVGSILGSGGSNPNIRGGRGGPTGPLPHHAAGGFVAGSSGSPQLVLAHAGEVILNPMQQAAFGGAAFFKQTFGFTEGASSFAAGGIVGKPKRRHAAKSPHHPRRNRVNAKTKAAQGILSALDEIDENESNADRAYGQLIRQFDISQEQFIRTDASGNSYVSQPDINQRVSEIDQLITARNNYLALLDEEKAELRKAVEKLKAAIHALVKAINAEREQATADAVAVRDLGKQLGRESAKKKSDQKIVNSLQGQISARGTSRSNHLSNAGNLSSTLSQFRSSLAGVQENLADTLPMDRRDVSLDIATLQAERKDVTGTTLPSSGAVSGGGSTDNSSALAALIAQIAQLNLALSIQGAQQSVIGSFAKGTLSVPETGLALVHAGESITPAGQARGGVAAASSQPHVEIHFEKGLEWLEGHTRVIVDGRIQELGRRANERARSSRY